MNILVTLFLLFCFQVATLDESYAAIDSFAGVVKDNINLDSSRLGANNPDNLNINLKSNSELIKNDLEFTVDTNQIYISNIDSVKWSANQPANHPANQSAGQSANQMVDQTTNHLKLLVDQSDIKSLRLGDVIKIRGKTDDSDLNWIDIRASSIIDFSGLILNSQMTITANELRSQIVRSLGSELKKYNLYINIPEKISFTVDSERASYHTYLFNLVEAQIVDKCSHCRLVSMVPDVKINQRPKEIRLNYFGPKLRMSVKFDALEWLDLVAKVTVEREQLVAKYNLAKNQKIDIQNVEVKKTLTGWNGLSDLSLKESLNKVTKNAFMAGHVLTYNDIELPLVIKSGSFVNVIFNGSGFEIETQMRALNSAKMGQSVTLINPVTKETLKAQAIDYETAEISK